MVEADFVESRRGRIGRNMAPDVRMKPVRFNNHGHHRIPAHVALDTTLDFAVARIRRFLRRGIVLMYGVLTA